MSTQECAPTTMAATAGTLVDDVAASDDAPWVCARCGAPLATESELERESWLCDRCAAGNPEWIGEDA